MTREPIYAALFAKLSTIPGLVTTSRRLRHWADVQAVEQPALFQVQKREHQQPRKGLPAKVSLQCEIYLYVNTGNDMDVTPATTLNPLMDAIEAALAPDPLTGFQTLGGTVSHCWIEGEIVTDEGMLGPQGVVIIPVNILTNN
ncbi:hypothetical protein X986_3951 [Burkholderia pseudomallei]|uniref:hypothetical protein n=1 Tax=Burkholderia pseudomallei TaxID=28450 RepID=UPI00050F4E91|nr:hypothetical protein [Burkholderia pseudomallei]AIV86366.1 hypothetical protein X995_5133 [Burkholderia pseudomallei B03]AIV93940.1 hypothetical protein X996_5955 [Burkholderia pseudomallei A79A]KGC50911.1 hypothetical protein DO66_5808 [Burkholderia pseudomallei]KGD51956.1 hypothetical protein DP49_1930 [Burkholderia pseudomallei]KGX12232.1 hypothetical protein X984_3536 [Burkholderia pseudomallei]